MEETYDRFTGFGMPPEGCADYAFLLHMLKSMDPDHGRAAIILPHGVLFRGGQEEQIRTKLITKGYIEGIIGLPANLFYGTGIPACIIVLDKKNASNRKNIFIIDASKNYIKDGNKNKLREEDIKKIVDTYNNKIIESKYSDNVSIEKIASEQYNLNIPRYVDASLDEMKPDLKAHLLGGIPKSNIDFYNNFWTIAPELKNFLFSNDTKEGYYILNIEKDDVLTKINESFEIKSYIKDVKEKIYIWENKVKSILLNLNNEMRVKEIIENISNELLEIFNKDILINKYDAYEYLMNYYDSVLKDDLYMITDNGWIPTLSYTKDKNGKIKKNEFDSELLPKQIIINKYFNEEQSKIDDKSNELNSLISEFESLVEENTGDENLFKDDEKVNEKLLKELRKESNDDELTILEKLLKNLTVQKDIKKEIKTLQELLNDKVISKYDSLEVDECKNIIVYDKWFASIEEKFSNCINNIISNLSSSIVKLEEEYEYTLEDINEQINIKEQELSSLLKELVGDADDMKAFNEFIKELGGE